jgi:hypothetical protein
MLLSQTVRAVDSTCPETFRYCLPCIYLHPLDPNSKPSIFDALSLPTTFGGLKCPCPMALKN